MLDCVLCACVSCVLCVFRVGSHLMRFAVLVRVVLRSVCYVLVVLCCVLLSVLVLLCFLLVLRDGMVVCVFDVVC